MQSTRRGRRLSILGAAVLALAVACGRGTELEVRTYELSHLDPGRAAELIRPYVFSDRPEAPGEVSGIPGSITVRETPDNLAKIERVLERFDRAGPAVRLHFRIIEADGRGPSDPATGDVGEALRELFRFAGYRLVGEAQVGAVEGSETVQVVNTDAGRFGIRSHVSGIRGTGEAGAVRLTVHLTDTEVGEIMESSMTVPAGETVVLGSSRVDPEAGAIILTVRPELVWPGGAPDRAPDAAPPDATGRPEADGARPAGEGSGSQG